MIYILTGDKKGNTYEYIFNVIKFYFDQNCPIDTGTIMIDFEKAVMNAIQNSLPGWEVSNCYFHLCQAVPVADVEEVFYEITYYIQANYPQLMVVVNYFELLC